MNLKYTREVLEIPVKESRSYSEVLRKLGVKWNGSTQTHLVKRIKMLGLDTSHFLGQRSNSGKNYKGGTKKIHWSKVLVNSRLGVRETTSRLRRALLESGRCYVCAVCKCPPEWQGNPLTLQIDHMDGDWLNNEPNNVRFICPNCHSQTSNFGSKNIGRLTELYIDDLYAWTGDEEGY